MQRVQWFIDVKFKNGSAETFGPYGTSSECDTKWKELGKQSDLIESIEKRRKIL